MEKEETEELVKSVLEGMVGTMEEVYEGMESVCSNLVFQAKLRVGDNAWNLLGRDLKEALVAREVLRQMQEIINEDSDFSGDLNLLCSIYNLTLHEYLSSEE